MKERKISSKILSSVASISAGVFLLFQQAYDGDYKSIASLCVGFALLYLMYVLWIEKKI